MLISGKLEFITETKIKGESKGVQPSLAWLWKDGKKMLLPYGKRSFFYPLGDEMGVKVYYRISTGKTLNKHYVKECFRILGNLYKKKLSPKPYRITTVDVGFGKVTRAYAIEIQRIHFPVEKMIRFCQGTPYEYGDEPGHTIQAYRRFRKRAKYATERKVRFRDVLYCLKAQRYYIVDEELK